MSRRSKQPLILFAVASFAAWAQSGNSTLSGVIRDESAAAIPSARVQITKQDSGIGSGTTTNSSGLYRVGALGPGEYRIEVVADGFEPATRENIVVRVNETVAVDLILRVGGHTDSVQVVDEAPLLQSQSSSVSQVVTREMLTGLPLPNRAASSLAALAPGVVMVDAGSGTAENYPVFTVAGGRTRNQTFVLDGGNVSNAVGLTRNQQLTSLPVDAMQEFQVISNNYSAEYGHSTGGTVVMSTRSGTNEYHGSFFESLQNDVLNARNFFASKRKPVRLNQFGASTGGPIVKNRTFFFITWEQTRQLTSDTVTSTVPTLLNRAGDFSDLRSSSGHPVAIYDPATTSGRTRQPFPGNAIPLDRMDPVARAVLAYFPAPNRAGTATNSGNFAGSSADTLDRNIVVAKLDHQFRSSDLVTARYYINDSGTAASGTYGNPAADPRADVTAVRVQSFLAAYTHIFSPSLTNDIRYSYLRRKFIDTRPGAGEDLASRIGLSGVSDAAFPAFGFSGAYAQLGNPSAVARHQTPILDRQILESLSWSRSKHAFKFGTEYRAGANDELRDRGSAGNFTFSPLITALPGVSGTGNALASFLIGEASAASIQSSDKLQTRASYLGFFVQDDWRVTDRLTVNAGLRWEAEIPRREIHDRMNSFDPQARNPISGTPGIVTFAGRGDAPERAFPIDVNNFGPRLGFAYRFGSNRQSVIRGGAGAFYGPMVSNTIGDAAALGFSTSASYVASQLELQSAMRLRDGFPTVSRQPLTDAFGAVPLGDKPNTSVSFFSPSQVAPTSFQYNVAIQHELARDLLVEMGYLANVSHHLTGNDFSLNQVPPQLMGPGDAQIQRPFPQFSNVTWINPSIGNSTYHGGFLRVEKRFTRGFSFLAHYTFSKFLDDVESSDEYGVTGSYTDAYNRRLDKGKSGSDVPHRLIVSALYQTPALHGNRFVKALYGGWKIGIAETAQSGAPFTVVTASDTTNAFAAGPLRPNLLRNPELPADERTIARWFDTGAFAAPASFTFGDSPRSVLRGAPLFTTDLTLEKSFAMTERWRLDLRSEFYNLLNHANFNTPGFTYGAADFGTVSSARAGRTAQLAARLSF